MEIKSGREISLSYHYALQAIIYKVLEKADSEYSAWLHNQGYKAGNKVFKLFTFADLNGKYRLDFERETLRFNDSLVTWQVSFFVDAALEHFIKGLFKDQTFELCTTKGKLLLEVKQVEILDKPVFTDTMSFKAIMPMCIAEETETDKYPQYRSPMDAAFAPLFFNNLNGKSKAIDESRVYNLSAAELNILSPPQKRSIETVKKELDRPIRVLGYHKFNFEITAPPALLELGYYAGFGARNSSGFGFCDVLKN